MKYWMMFIHDEMRMEIGEEQTLLTIEDEATPIPVPPIGAWVKLQRPDPDDEDAPSQSLGYWEVTGHDYVYECNDWVHGDFTAYCWIYVRVKRCMQYEPGKEPPWLT